MSTKKKLVVNRTELKVMITRLFGKQKEFCKYYGINYGTYLVYMRGNEELTNLNRKIVTIMIENGYNPYAETPRLVLSDDDKKDIERVFGEMEPRIKPQIFTNNKTNDTNNTPSRSCNTALADLRNRIKLTPQEANILRRK